MREQVQKCAEFFRARPGYHRIMTALLQKYRRSGRPAGNVCLPDASEEELEAARSFFGRSFSPPLRFQTVQFEAELQKGPFRGISLKDVLEAYFGVEIKTKKECRMALESRVSEVIRQAEAEGYRNLQDIVTKGEKLQAGGSRRWRNRRAAVILGSVGRSKRPRRMHSAACIKRAGAWTGWSNSRER